MACNLSPCELYKYNWRIDLFLEKLATSQPFKLCTGEEVVLDYSEEAAGKITHGDLERELVRGAFLTSGERSFRLSDFEKTTEFGGKGVGSTTAVEQREIRMINRQFDKMRPPKMRTQVGVYVKVGDEVHHIKSCSSVAGTPKADFALMNMKHKPVVWYSHKDGGGPTRFQQWSGISDKAGTNISRHDEVLLFIDEIRKLFPQGVPPATAVGIKIKDIKLKQYAVYGPKFGMHKYGIDNVTMVTEGNMILQPTREAGLYEFKAQNAHFNGEQLTGSYEPILYVQYRGDRGQFNIKNARFSIYPIGGNKKTIML